MNVIALLLLMTDSACSTVTDRPESNLWGEWVYAEGGGGELADA